MLKPVVTLEVRLSDRVLIQARGLQNRFATDAEQKLIQSFTTANSLTIAPHVFSAALLPLRRVPLRRHE